MKVSRGFFVVAMVIGGASAISWAVPVAMSLTPADFDSLLGGSLVADGGLVTSDMSTGNLHTTVVSQAFTDGDGNYAYLYQVKNTGTTGASIIEVFTTTPYFGASGATDAGYLTANAPTGFDLGDQVPRGASIHVPSGPTISFGFPSPWDFGDTDYAIDPGEDSVTLYILSTGEPGTITGNVIDGTIGSGPVVGPIPEPCTLVLLAMGACLSLSRRGRDKRR